jgi:hypothetical protein
MYSGIPSLVGSLAAVTALYAARWSGLFVPSDKKGTFSANLLSWRL